MTSTPATPAPIGGWYDRIQVRNASTGEMLLDNQLQFDPAVGGAGVPAAG
jgi:hypothetical protein